MNCHQTYHPFQTKLFHKSRENLFYLWLEAHPILISRFRDIAMGPFSVGILYHLFGEMVHDLCTVKTMARILPS